MRLLVCAVVAAGLALGMAGTAEAKQVRPPALISGWTDAGDGLRLYVQGETRANRVGVTVERFGGRGWQAMSYSSRERGDVSGRHVRSTIGERGTVGMRFRAAQPTQVDRYRCLRLKQTRGVLVGHFRFRGEGRYVEADVSRMRALRSRVDDSKCTPGDLFREPRADGQRLPATLTACGPGFSAYQVQRRRSGAAEIVVFGESGFHDGLYSSAFIAKQIPFSAFTYANDFSAATLALPPPFNGTGFYSSAEGGSITGDFRWRALDGRTSSLTGVREVQLAGGDHRACAGFFTVGRRARSGDPAARLLLRSQMQRRLRAVP